MATRQYAKTAQRRSEIVAAALEVFSEQGYRDAPVREIARRVNLSEAGLLHHFGSKVELLTAVLKMRDEVDIANYDRGNGEIETMRAFFAHNLSVPNLISLYTKLSVEAIDPAHPAHGYFTARMRAVLRRFEQRLGEDRRRGLVRADLDPRLAAYELHACFEGLQLLWLIDPSIDVLAIYDDYTARWLPAAADREGAATTPAVENPSGVSSIEVQFTARNLEPESTNRAHAPVPGQPGGVVVGADMHWHMEDALARMELPHHLTEGSLKFIRPIHDGELLSVRVESPRTGRLDVGIQAPGTRDQPRVLGRFLLGAELTPRWGSDLAVAPLPAEPVEFSEDFALAGSDLGTVTFSPNMDEANAHRAALGIMPVSGRDLPSAYLVQYSRRALLAPNVIGPRYSIHTATEFRQFARITEGETGLQVRGRYDRVFARRGRRYVVLRAAIVDASERVLLEAEYTSIYRRRPDES